MSDALSFAEIDGQSVELLPGRTVLSSYCGGHHGCDWDYYNEQTAEADSDAEAKQLVLIFGDDNEVEADNEAEAESAAVNIT